VTASKHPKRPRDFSQAAKLVIDFATGQAGEPIAPVPSAAAEMGRKGGKARAKALSKRKRQEIARKAAKSRWK
jgi:hypothetical protein